MKKYTIEEIKEIIEQTNGYVGREFDHHQFKTPGWSSGEYDIEVYVQVGSPAKSIIIIDNARKTARTIINDRVKKYYLEEGEEW